MSDVQYQGMRVRAGDWLWAVIAVLGSLALVYAVVDALVELRHTTGGVVGRLVALAVSALFWTWVLMGARKRTILGDSSGGQRDLVEMSHLDRSRGEADTS